MANWDSLRKRLLNHERFGSSRAECLRECDQLINALANDLLRKGVTIGERKHLTAEIGFLKTLRTIVLAEEENEEKERSGSGHAEVTNRSRILKWQEVESAFAGRLSTGIVANISHVDPVLFLKDAQVPVIEHIRNVLSVHKHLKVNACLHGSFKRDDKLEVKSISTSNTHLQQSTELVDWYAEHLIEPILATLEEFQERDSGWALTKILNLAVSLNVFSPLRGSCYLTLPKFVRDKKAVVNVQSFDEYCFARAIVAALYPANTNLSREASYPHYSEVLNLTGLRFPMAINDVHLFEIKNDVSINVYEVTDRSRIGVLYLTKLRLHKHVNLLLHHHNGQSHYSWIKNLSRLVSRQLSKCNGRRYICDRCLHYFRSNEDLKKHEFDCENVNDCAIVLPSKEEGKNYITFKNYANKEKVPFVIYADLECILRNEPQSEEAESTYMYQRHEVHSIGYYLHSVRNRTESVYRARRGEDCIAWFVREVQRIGSAYRRELNDIKRMHKLSPDEENAFLAATECHICERPFNAGVDKIVRDHCHLTGKFRGAAHTECNLSYIESRVIPIVFHNLSGYDAHFLMNEISKVCKGYINVLPITKERYISFTVFMGIEKVSLRFIDSYKFLSASLDYLSSCLRKEDMRILRSQFNDLTEEQFELLTRKGVFPYEFVSDYEKLNETSLPPAESFFSRLTGSDVSSADYAHAQTVWNKFSIRTLGEYSDLYLKTDVLLLADVFENFRVGCIGTYGLDPLHYVTLPGYTWDAMLKHTKVKLEQLIDIDIVLFIECGIRGGMSQCSNRYAKANNKYTKSIPYDPDKPTTYLMYFDVNNLYGWAMSQELPYDGFEWVDDPASVDVRTIPDDSPIGYILEVDLEYPRNVHDSH